MFDGAGNDRSEYEPLSFRAWWPAMVMVSYVSGALIAVLMYG